MGGFISKLAELVSFCMSSIVTLAGSLKWLCNIYCCVPGTFIAEAFAKVKMSLKYRKTSKRQTSKRVKNEFTSLVTWSAV